METRVATSGVHHLQLTVTDVARSREFYTNVLGFDVVGNHGSTQLLSDGFVTIGLAAPPDPSQAIERDLFNENRVGLDHLSLRVARREDLDRAVRLLDERGVMHSDVVDLGPELRFHVVVFRDPDNIQLELTADYEE